HIFVIEIVNQGILERHAAADVQGVQIRVDLLEFAIERHVFLQFVPVVRRIGDARINEEMEQLNTESRIRSYLVVVKIEDVLQTSSQTASIARSVRLLSRSNPYAEVTRFLELHLFIVNIERFLIVQHRYNVLITIMQHINDVLLVL